MTTRPRCVNCFQEFHWTPLYHEARPYCCDGCAMGGPCVCTYNSAPPRLDIKDILSAAGYNANALAEELTVCANCFDEFRRPPVQHQGAEYCCEGCAQGGPCVCTYDAAPDSATATAPGDDAPAQEDTHPAPQPQRPAPFRANRLWDSCPSQQPSPGAPRLTRANRLWHTHPGKTTPPPPPTQSGVRTNSLWSQDTRDDTDDLSLQEDQTQGQDEPTPSPEHQQQPRQESLHVHASPLASVAEVRWFMAALEKLPSIESVMLVHYGAGRASFQVTTRSIQRTVKEAMDVGGLSIHSISLTPEGLEIVLPHSIGTGHASSPQAGYGDAPDSIDVREYIDARLRELGALGAVPPENDPHTPPEPEEMELGFRFEVGVNAFFNGRHQVEMNGVCGPIHMHSWRVQAILEGRYVDEADSSTETSQIQQDVASLVEQYNNQLLNRVPPFDEITPTNHNIARVIYEHVEQSLSGSRTRLKAIRLWESPTSYVEYAGG